METIVRLFVLTCCLSASLAQAQTSWKGTSSTAWGTAANWTAGVPTASVDAIIGDANFTGSNQPALGGSSVCKSLTIGTGTKVSALTVSKALTVSGNITIGANGTVTHNSVTTISLTGNWTNSGTYNPTKVNCNVTFSGAAQTIGGTATTAFKKITINTGSTATLAANISVVNQLTVSGTLDPNESSTFAISGAGNLAVNAGGKILVKAATFAGNYATTGTTTLNAGSIVEYAAASASQTVSSALTYSTLRISGGGTRTLAANLTALNSTVATAGNIDVSAGTLDLAGFTADRGATVAGGTFSVANGATLKIGGVNSFPAGYATHSLGSASTVEYSGTAQTVSAEAYGHLTLSSSSGSVTKTFPATVLTLAGNLTSSLGAGTAVSFTAGAAITVGGNVSIGAGTTFNGSSFAHTVAGNWTNNGTFTGATSTVTLSGTSATLSGTGANNFNNLTISGAGVTAAAATDLTVAGNFSTTGSGTFTHTTGGAGKVTLSGASKSVSGAGISFNHLTVSGSLATASSFGVAGNLAVSGSLSASAGTITLSGASKSVSGAGTMAFNGLNVSGSISTANNFSLASDLSVSGTLTASAGTATFVGTSTLSGTANLFNATLNGSRLQLGSSAVLGIAGLFTATAGAFDVITSTPNTVAYNGAGAQTVLATTYDNVTLAGSGTKTAGGALTVNRDLSIASGSTFSAGSLTHTLLRNWINGGSFTAGASTIILSGASDSSISGATTFNALTVNKSSSANVVALNANMTVATLNMTQGEMDTGANVATLTSTRTGGGLILGTITRTHAFSTGTAYAFEGTNNTVNFSSASGVSSITMTVGVGAIGDFPFGGSINRQYTVSVTASGAYNAALRLHYADSELNGNSESAAQLWHYGTSWTASGKTGNDAANNWVEQSGLTALSGRWTLSDDSSVARWNGSVSTAWETAANWIAVQGSPSLPPSTNDTVELGTTTFTFAPTINSAASVKSISFGSAQATTLTLGASGSLVTIGNITGSWTNNATHTINVGNQNLTVGGNLTLSDGTISHAINLTAGTGTVTISGSLTESGGANVTFTGAGNQSIGGDFNYVSGTFAPGSGTVTYNGSAAQIVAGVTYNHLTFNKTGGTATLSTSATVNGNLALTNGGTFQVNAPLAVAGNATINAGTTLNCGSATISAGGDWAGLGTFTPGTGTVLFNGSGNQSIANGSFNHLTINKTAGTATLATNLTINGDLNLSAGMLDLATFAADRSAVGGTLTLAASTTLRVGSSFPANFGTRALAGASAVEYNGAAAQTVSSETYGHLIFSNGGSNAKTLAGASTVGGNLLINSGATFTAGSFSLGVQGNWTNGGTFTASTSTVTLSGSGKTLSGATTFNHLTVSGSYTGVNNVTVNGTMTITGTYAAGSTTTTLAGDFANSGAFTSSGTVTFAGTGAQNLTLSAGFSTSGTVNFNGSVAPTFGGPSAPGLQNVNVNNTAGIAPNLGWTIGGVLTVASGATFTGGLATHTFNGNFTNNGTVTSSGTLQFLPASGVTLTLRGTSFLSSGTVVFGGTGQITLAGGAPSFNSVSIANTHAAGLTPNVNWTLSGNLNIGGTFNGGSGLTHTIFGNISDNGVLNGGTSTVVLNGTTEVSGAGAITFNNLTISGSVVNTMDIAVSGNFTNNGAFDATGSDVTFNGSGASIIAGSTTPTPIDSLVIAKTAATVTLAVNLGSLTSLTISSGTLDSSTFTINEATGGLLTMGAGATLKIGGSNPLPTFDTYSFDPLSLVEFGGTGAQSIAAQNYGGLKSSSTGARTLASSGTIGISGALTPGANTYTITGSTIDFNGSGAQTVPAFNFQNLASSSSGARTLAASGTIGVAGTFTPGANSYTVTGSTINFNGAAQTIPAFTYGSLTTSGSGAKTLSGNITVGGALTLSAGSLADGGFTATVTGDVANNATQSGSGKILLSGSSTNHVLSGSGAFQNLELNDSNGAALSLTNLTVNGTLTLTTGVISTSTNKVIVATGASLTRTNGHVNGSLQKNVETGATTRTFEIGDATTYAPVTISFGNVTAAGNLVASTTAGDHPDIANSGISAARSVNRYWTITNSGVAFNTYGATLNFVAGDIDAGADTAIFIVAKRTGTTWSLPTVGTKTSTNTQATGMTSFGDFQVGESSALPAVTTQPQSQRVNLGSPVTFTVAASGPTLSYQWRTNTVNISGATSTSYAIASAQDSHAGSYSCLVTNPNGSDLSSSAVLTINHPPSLAAIANQTIDEVAAWRYTNSVSDADGGTFTWALAAAPSGASISSSGVISWTPSEAQGPSTNTFTAQVSDDGSPALTDSKTFTVMVIEVNLAPTLTLPGTQTINELTTLTVTNTATDPDIPANTLTFSLVSPPGGMTIGSSSGVISWTPTSAQSPSTNTVTVRVTDNGSPPLSDTKSFTAIANHVPIAGTATFERPRDLSLKILISNLLTNATDSKGHVLALAGVGATSTNGATITTNGAYILYPVPPGGNVADRFSYTVSDGTTNATGLVIITIKADSSGQTQNIVSIAPVAGGVKIIFAAIPGLPYLVQRTGSLSEPVLWGTLATVAADSQGRFEYVDLGPPSPSYYRSAQP